MPNIDRDSRVKLLMRRGSVVLALLAFAACGGGSQPATPAPAPAPLASLAGQRVLLLPASHLDLTRDSAAVPSSALGRASTLASLDSAIERALAARARSVTWVTVEQIARTSRRNPTMAPDPYALSTEGLRRPAVRAQTPLLEPLASQIRTLTALNDGRLVLYPLELRMERTRGMGRASLRVALVDARMSQVVWIGDVQGQSPGTSLGPLLEDVAGRLADLFAAE